MTVRRAPIAAGVCLAQAGAPGSGPARGRRARPGADRLAGPELRGGPWINSPALSRASLRGRGVLVEFWTLG